MASHPSVEPVGKNTDEVPEEMMAELKKEIARNLEATRLVKERESEATEARDRAAESHRKMHEMMKKYEDMKKKLEWTRITLAETHNRLQIHNDARQERIKESVNKLKDRADQCTTKINEKNQRNALAENATNEDVKKLDVIEEADNGGLTDAERALLQLCQQQRMEDGATATPLLLPMPNLEPEPEKAPVESEKAPEVPDLTSLDVVEEPAQLVKPVKDYAKTVLEIQMKYGNGASSKSSSQPEESQQSQPDDVEAVASTEDHEPEAAKEMGETVTKMEAKCAGVREELGQMAMSEQYMRTKQAILHAKRREKEAVEAMEAAEKKEREAQEMRRKVMDMMRLLEERRNKLKMTEKVLEKKAVVVDKVNKLLDSKERKAHNVEKHIEEVKAFDIEAQKNDKQ